MSDNVPPAVPEPTPPTSGNSAQPPAGNPYAAQPAGSPYGASYGGQPTGSPYTAAGSTEPKTLSIISMITGIIGVVSFGWFGIASIAALILGYMGKKREPAAKGFWLTGIITGWVGVALMILVVGGTILLLVLGANSGFGAYTDFGELG
jgi:hypothetical protein